MQLILCLILITLRNPYTEKSGQSYNAVTRLQEIASIEQARADWRNSTFSIFSWATLIGLAIWFWQIAQNPEQLLATFSSSFKSLSPMLEQVLEGIGLFLWFINIFAIALWIRLTNILTHYYSTESANRLVLISCIEAQSLLEQLGLREKDKTSLADKKRIAKFLGCEIIVEDAPNFSLLEFAEGFIHEDRKYWVVKRRPIKNRVSKFPVIISKAGIFVSNIRAKILKRFRPKRN